MAGSNKFYPNLQGRIAGVSQALGFYPKAANILLPVVNSRSQGVNEAIITTRMGQSTSPHWGLQGSLGSAWGTAVGQGASVTICQLETQERE